MSHLGVHIDGLMRRFGAVSVVSQNPDETVLMVRHTAQVGAHAMTLNIAIRNSTFPDSPPVVTYGGMRVISIAPGDPAGVAQITEEVWSPGRSQLADAVGNAFSNLAELWGGVPPVSSEEIRKALQTKSDAVLEDIASNPNCLESFSYQLSFSKKVRDARAMAADDVERAVQRNRDLQKEVAQVRDEVGGLQRRFKSQIAAVREARGKSPLLDAIGSPEALARTFAADVRALDMQCEKIAKDLLLVDYSSGKREFDNMMEEYRLKAKERHIMDLKRRAYYASLA